MLLDLKMLDMSPQTQQMRLWVKRYLTTALQGTGIIAPHQQRLTIVGNAGMKIK